MENNIVYFGKILKDAIFLEANGITLFKPVMYLRHNAGATLDQTLAHLFLFWPSFKQMDDIVYINIGANYVLTIEGKMHEHIGTLFSSLGSNKEVEKEANRIQIGSYFLLNDAENTEMRISFFCKRLIEMWKAKIAHEFPEKRFVFELNEEKWEITFYCTD